MLLKPKHIHTLNFNGFQWINITQNTPHELNWLKKTFGFEADDLRDCLPPPQRPKLVERQNYLFMALLFPVYNRKTQEIKPAEVDFFISGKYLITIHDSQVTPLREFFTLCEQNKKFSSELMEEGPAGLIHEIISRLFNYCFPILNHINNDIGVIEDKIFTSQGIKLIYEISLIKKNIVNFRKAIQTHKNVIHRLVDATARFFPNLKLDSYSKNLLEQTREIWDVLENNRETINALHETRASLSSYRLNQVMKTLTIISVIFMPLNLIAFIFGMNTKYHPIVGQPYDFWIIVGLMAILTGILVFGFKKKKWFE